MLFISRILLFPSSLAVNDALTCVSGNRLDNRRYTPHSYILFVLLALRPIMARFGLLYSKRSLATDRRPFH